MTCACIRTQRDKFTSIENSAAAGLALTSSVACDVAVESGDNEGTCTVATD